jgi:hypothetical protein
MFSLRQATRRLSFAFAFVCQMPRAIGGRKGTLRDPASISSLVFGPRSASRPGSYCGPISSQQVAFAVGLIGDHTDSLAERLSGVPGRLSNWRILTPAAAVFALCLALVPDVLRSVQAASYVDTAVAAHRSYLRGNLPFGLGSNSSATVMAWFAGKVPFDFRLPAAESVPEQNPAYRLTGATLVNFKGGPAALVTPARTSCVVCHQSMVDNNHFKTHQ